jgi:hypothetical protein
MHAVLIDDYGFKERTSRVSRQDDLNRFNDLLRELRGRIGGARMLSQCDGRMTWPQRGVYFFFEQGEMRSNSGTEQRVVRVGTHALTATSRTTLWNRLVPTSRYPDATGRQSPGVDLPVAGRCGASCS